MGWGARKGWVRGREWGFKEADDRLFGGPTSTNKHLLALLAGVALAKPELDRPARRPEPLPATTQRAASCCQPSGAAGMAGSFCFSRKQVGRTPPVLTTECSC